MKSIIAGRFSNIKAQIALDAEALGRYSDVIDLSIGDCDITTDPEIIDAAASDAASGYTKYGDPKGDPQLIKAIQASYKADYGIDLDESGILVTPSSCMGMALVMLAILDPGDQVLVLSPYFSVYEQQIELAGGVCIEVPTYEKDDWIPQSQAIRAAITPKTKAIIVNNPVNPTGAFYDSKCLRDLARIGIEADLLVIADEIYTDYVLGASLKPIMGLEGMRERTITLNSFSKNFMMTGWRVGYVIASPSVVSVMQSINGAMIYTTPSISQRAAIKALSVHSRIRESYVSVYMKRMEYAYQRIKNIPFFSMSRPRGTFYVFPSIKATGLSSRAFADYAYDKCHILCTPGSAFGSAGEGYVRFALTQDISRIKEAFDRLEKLHFA